MAYAGTTHTAHLIKGPAFLATAIEALMERYAQHRLYRRTLNELALLSPRDRCELGLSPNSLRAAAYQAVYGTND